MDQPIEVKLPEGSYKEYLIPKRGGKKFRKIVAPSTELLKYQRSKLNELESIYKAYTQKTAIENTAHGFIRNRNCVTAAKLHIGFSTTIMMDISNFFDSVTPDMVNFYSKSLSENVSLWHQDNYAAQGFATSPMLANLAIIPALHQIQEMLEDNFIASAFTIYADDLHISVNSEDLDELNDIITSVIAIVENSKFKINKRKTRIRYSKFGFRRILGVNVGQTEIRATRKTMRKLRAAKHQKNGPSAGGLTTWSRCLLPKAKRK